MRYIHLLLESKITAMNFLVTLICVSTALIVSCGGQQIKNANIDSLLSDRQFVKKQINCVLGKSRCDSFGQSLRASIPKVIDGNCRSCTPEEAKSAEKIVTFVKTNHPQVWEKILQKYSKKN